MSRVLTIYPEKCIYCRSCELICSFVKIGEFNPGESAVSVLYNEAAAVSAPVMCMQCKDAACMKVCPSNAIKRNGHGVLVADQRRCTGCKLCVSACPLGNIFYSYEKKKIIKCDLCGGDPQCAKICPTGAIQFED